MRLDLTKGGHAELVETDGDSVVVVSTAPSPPGSPLEGSEAGVTFQIKVRSCRRVGPEEPARFRIEGRWVNLSRAQRERVLSEKPAD